MQRKESKKDVKKSTQVEKKEEQPKINFEDIIFSNLSNLTLTFDQSGYHFVDLDLSSQSLDVLSNVFNNYKHLQRIKLNQNNLADFSILGNLPFLMSLDLAQNNIKDMKALLNEEGFKSLKVNEKRSFFFNNLLNETSFTKYLNLTKNRLVEIGSIKNAQSLTHLVLSDNLIDKTGETFDGHPQLRVLELRGNRILTLATFLNLPELRELYIPFNRIKIIQGLDGPNLQILHLRGNMIDSFQETFPNFENLQYLNFRQNAIVQIDELNKTSTLPKLQTLIFSFNPIIQKNPLYLFDTINVNLQLQRINQINITKNIQQRAYAHAEQKWLEAQVKINPPFQMDQKINFLKAIRKAQEAEEKAKQQALQAAEANKDN